MFSLKPIHDIEAEKAVLGSLFLEPQRTMSILQQRGCCSEWFFDPQTRTVFDAVVATLMSGGKVDSIIVKQFLPPEFLGERDIVFTIAQWCDMATPAYALHYINILKAKHELRSVQHLCQKTVTNLEEHVGPVAELVSEFRHKLSLIPTDGKVTADMATVIGDVVRSAELAKQRGCARIQSRWYRLQRAFGGYPRGKLTLVGADPGGGKTTFASNEVSHTVLKGIPCAVASMEMTAEEWIENAACAEANLDASRLRNGEFSTEEMALFNQQAELFKKAPLYINDKTHSIGSLCSFMRDMGTDKKCELIVFDYVQMIKTDIGHRSRNEEVGSWSNQIILTAKELPNTAIVGVSQLNRPPPGKFQEPDLNRLRDSGSLGQDAYLVLLLYQDPNAGDDKMIDDAPTIIKVEKHRGGKSGKHMMVFKKSHQKFIE